MTSDEKQYLFKYTRFYGDRPGVFVKLCDYGFNEVWWHWCDMCCIWEPFDISLVNPLRLRSISRLEFLVLTGHNSSE